MRLQPIAPLTHATQTATIMVIRPTESQFRFMTVAAVCAAAVLAYANTIDNEFVWDDVSSVLLHEHVKDPSRFLQLFQEDQHAFGRGQGSFYRPLVSVSFMIDAALSRVVFDAGAAGEPSAGIKPPIFHITNLVWHAAASLLLLALLTRLDAPRFVRAAVPLIYAVHPLQTEAVAYVSGRADPMAATFMFAALWCALRQGPTRKRVVWAALSALLFAAALLSKESAAIFPVLLLALVMLSVRSRGDERSGPDILPRFIPVALSLLALAAYAWWRFAFLDLVSESTTPDGTLAETFIQTGQAFALYVRLFFVPTGLHMERTLEGLPAWLGALGWLFILACLAGLIVSLMRKYQRTAVALAWFLLTWFPVSGLIPLNAPMAEHWMYVPLAGFFWAVLEVLWTGARRARLEPAAAGVVCIFAAVCLVLTVSRNRDWRDNPSIFKATLEYNPESTRVHYNLAVTYEDLIGNRPGARRHYERVVELYAAKKADEASAAPEQFWDEELESHLSLGNIYLQQHRYEKAMRHFGTLLGVKPTDRTAPIIVNAAIGMGQCYLAVGDTERAARIFEQVLKMRPDLEDYIDRMTPNAV